ncbi:hypothetical protein EX30DRAFT_365472 [Ascodesmis nigricans]|uniref:Fe2OG dioxygenase domain-containing protein n=1 Tax=Ascodesmis nigricans TaxID=341454 RepID=A0A4V3SI88_9PEZI|nr:hypothetical protein EX30DRAFT_365472 [Ascodesmis nigricans]
MPQHPTRIPHLPPSLHYLPSFITPSEESTLLTTITSQPIPKWTILSHRRLQSHPSTLSKSNTLITAPLPAWLECLVPRIEGAVDDGDGGVEVNLNDLGEDGRVEGTDKGKGIWEKTKHMRPNHVLINEYKPGEGIMPHEDGPAYEPVVATVSLGGAVVLEVRRKRVDGEEEKEEEGEEGEGRDGGKEKPVARILLEPRSLFITTRTMYTNFLHSISPIEVDEDLGPETIANWELLGDREMYKDGRNVRVTRTSLTYRDVTRVVKVGGLLGGRR